MAPRHNLSQPIDLTDKTEAEMQPKIKPHHMFSKLIERLISVLHSAVDLIHQIPVGFIMGSAWAWGSRFFNFDYDFIGWVGILFFVDTFLGVYKHIRLRTATAEGFSKFFDKMVVLAGAIIVMHVIESQGGETIAGDFYSKGAHLTVIAWLAWSVFKNISDITKGQFPPKAWIEKLESFLYQKKR